MARGNKYFQDNYDRKYGIQYIDFLCRHAIKKFFRKYYDLMNSHSNFLHRRVFANDITFCHFGSGFSSGRMIRMLRLLSDFDPAARRDQNCIEATVCASKSLNGYLDTFLASLEILDNQDTLIILYINL
jgi:hypothetical protein